MPRKLSEVKIKKIKELRRAGLSVNEISRRLQVAPATVFYYARDVDTEKNETPSVITANNLELLTRLMKRSAHTASLFATILIDGLRFTQIDIPFTIVCPYCGIEQSRIGFCIDSGEFFCVGTERKGGCGKNIDLKTAPRKEELSLT